jgi:prepilin-type N-terminal cleavage/methylation domain-containing protein
MRATLQRLRARLVREERGFTLVEVLVAAALSVVVFMATLAFVNASRSASEKNANRSDSVLEARDGLERLIREARTALPVGGATPSPVVTANSLVFQRVAPGASSDQTFAAQAKQWIRWACSGTRCSRTSSTTYPPPSSGGSALITGLSSTNVFALVGTNMLEVTLNVSVAGGNSPADVVLKDGVSMRNVP